jgi:putative Mg2+ transporter-C (MgtC) family protein
VKQRSGCTTQSGRLKVMMVFVLLARVLAAGLIGGAIGYERRVHRKAIGVAGMILVAVGSAAYMVLAQQEATHDPAAVSRALQGLLAGIGFLGGAVIFKSGGDVRGIKTAAAIWITGAIGMAIGTGFWWLGVVVGIATVIILFVTDHLTGRSGAVSEEGASNGQGRTEQRIVQKR